MSHIKDNLAQVELQITAACQQAKRHRNDIQLLAVSKTKPAAQVQEAYNAGQIAFGENYLQEAVEKIQQLSDLERICWHFIGPIQSNKTRLIAEHFSWVQSVDRKKIITRLNEQRCSQDTPLNVCLQVNISGEASKSGIEVNELDELAQMVDSADNLTLRGLMAIPEKHNAAESFAKMSALFQSLQQRFNTVDTLSMGMSGDLSEAISNGSTMVRIGTAIFGARA
ncbi:YggS family pyridoxal phosphate-dependent enzyme [Thalassotalea hakodatensis]|uniref:YggS family pyridoxal phosphate-dependent enzyme n=1 Tax=Thalassotalea hakodatensis TaxID=3030492 RepID=UPI00257398DD|nr:YggS family pyridoxal phosphate-dependent enzyme [Thalassotalea hakodatensis]